MHFPAAALPIGILLFGSDALALPQYPGTMPPDGKQCQDYTGVTLDNPNYEWRNMKQEEYDAEPELVTGTACDSPCSITKGYTWTKSATVSLGGSNGGTEVLSKAWQWFAKAALSGGMSWTTSEGEMTTTSLECPFDKKGAVCGVMATPKMAKITGQNRLQTDSGLCSGYESEWADVEIHAPVTKKTWDRMDTGKDGADDIYVVFSSCIADCETPELCVQAIKKGFEVCPEHDKPEAWKEAERNAVAGIVDAVQDGAQQAADNQG